MKHTIKYQQKTKRSGITLAAAVACALFGVGSALADPPPDTPTFIKADISIEPRGEEAGGLTCSWREGGLDPIAVYNYDCAAGAVGVLEGCVYKNKLVSNTPVELSIFQDVTGEGHDGVAFLSKNNGTINASTTTAIPEAHGGGHLCIEPTEQAVLAVRWCNASLTDTTNGLVGAVFTELYKEFFSGMDGNIPSCSELLAAP